MDLKTIALAMYPYWLMGAGVLAAMVIAGQKKVIRVEKKAFFDFAKFLAVVTLYRIVLFKIFGHTKYLTDAAANISIIPWPLTLTVFWEDACHGLPLFLLKRLIGDRKWLKPFYYLALGLVMFEFGLGHVYQGVLSACMLSLYIPYSIKLGEKYGFGTVMLSHTLFDLTTILSIKFLLGA